MKFTTKTVDGLDGKLTIFSSGDFQVIASIKGVQFMGRSEICPDELGLREFAEVVTKAFKEHRKLIVIHHPAGFNPKH